MRRLNITKLRLVRAGERPPNEFLKDDPCPKCADGVIGVDKTVRTCATVTQYLKCAQCGFLPENKIVIGIHIS